MHYFLFDQNDEDGLFRIRLKQNQFKNDIELRGMEKGRKTIQPWHNESESKIFCFRIYRVFK